jgi:glycosidase
MLGSVYSKEFDAFIKDTMEKAKLMPEKKVKCNRKTVKIPNPYPSPEDWRDHWIYFIMIDRFNNPDPNSPPKSELKGIHWDDPYEDFQGGTFNGISDKLDYIKSLGATAIWITPPFKNCRYENTYYGYGIHDFLSIDSRFGTEEDLQNLVDQAHARGLYVILDIVLNHCGNIFKYIDKNGNQVDDDDWQDSPYDVRWLDKNGKAKSSQPISCGPDECVWPSELQNNEYFRRQGKFKTGNELQGDFYSLKEIVTEYVEGLNHYPVRDVLIKSYQYIIAKYDIDGFRIDTLKFIERPFSTAFANAIREFALSIGKKNFFTFGEVWDNESKIAGYVGRFTSDEEGVIGVDATLDFPLYYSLTGVIKRSDPPSNIVNMYEERKKQEKDIIGYHGEASKFFVTFLDNHDQTERFYFWSADHTYDAQVTIGIGALFTLLGIPCLYYGTEQGLHGSGTVPEAVREALWGMPDAFDHNHPICKSIQELSELRSTEAALRYGRQYFREVSGNGLEFGISTTPGGILAYSRVLADEEILIVINTNVANPWEGDVVIDYDLNSPDPSGKMPPWQILYSNLDPKKKGMPVEIRSSGNAVIQKVNGNKSQGSVRMLPVPLMPMEMQILKRGDILA